MSCYRKDTIDGTLRLRFKRRSYYYTFTPCVRDAEVARCVLPAIQAQTPVCNSIKNNVEDTRH